MNSPPLRIMLVDQSQPRGQALAGVLREHGCEVLAIVSSDDYLPDRVRAIEPDVILIDVDAPNRDTLEQISALNREMPRPVVMFTADDDPKMIRDAVAAGVSAYVVDGLNSARVRSVIDVAIEHFRQFQQMRGELTRARTALEERKLIERAKGILMAQRRINEDDAYKAMRRLAMNRNRRMVDIARDVIDMADLLGDTTPEPRPRNG